MQKNNLLSVFLISTLPWFAFAFPVQAESLDTEVVAYMEHTHAGSSTSGTGCYAGGSTYTADGSESGVYIDSGGNIVIGDVTDTSTYHHIACGKSNEAVYEDHVGKIKLSTNNDGEYHNGGNVTISCNILYWDSVSGDYSSTNPSDAGVSNVRYSWNGKSFTTTENTKDVTNSGEYTCYVKYIEGGIEKTTELTINVVSVATGAPTVEVIYDTLSQEYYASNVLELDVTKSLGLPDEPYSFDGGATWTASNKYLVTANGTYALRVRDIYGNIWKSNYVVSNIELTAPVISAVTKDTSDWVKNSVTVTVSTTDAGIGLDATPYSFDNGKTWTGNNFYQYTENGKYTILVRDKLYNVASKTIYIRNIDKTAPVVLLTVPSFWAADKESITLTVTAYDAESGLAASPYSYDNGSSWTSSETYTISKEGSITIKVVDKVGNAAYETIYAMKDNTTMVVGGLDLTTQQLTLSDGDKMLAIISGAGVKKTEMLINDGVLEAIVSAEDLSGLSDFNFSDENAGFSTNDYEDNSKDALSDESIYLNNGKVNFSWGDVSEVAKAILPYALVGGMVAGLGAFGMAFFTRLDELENEKKKKKKRK